MSCERLSVTQQPLILKKLNQLRKHLCQRYDDAIQLFLEYNSTIAVNQINDNNKWH